MEHTTSRRENFMKCSRMPPIWIDVRSRHFFLLTHVSVSKDRDSVFYCCINSLREPPRFFLSIWVSSYIRIRPKFFQHWLHRMQKKKISNSIC